MIAVTRLDGRQMLVNADLIETIEQTPDTIVTFSSGHKLIVRDSPEELARHVIEYRRALLAGPPLVTGHPEATTRADSGDAA